MLYDPANLEINESAGNDKTFAPYVESAIVKHTADSGRSDIKSIRITIVKLETKIAANVTQLFDEQNEVPITGIKAEYGQDIIIEVEENDDDLFQFALVNGVIRNDFVVGDNTLPMTEDLEVSLVYATEDNHAVLFIDSNGKLLHNEWVENGANATPQSVANLSKPGYQVSDTPWLSNDNNSSLENIDSSRVYTLQYVTNEDELTIKVNNVDRQVSYNEIVTVESTNPNFKAWLDGNGNVLSTKPLYKFTALKNMTLVESVTEHTKPYVIMTDDLKLRDPQEELQTFLAQIELDEES